MCSSIQVFLLFSSCSVGDAICFSHVLFVCLYWYLQPWGKDEPALHSFIVKGIVFTQNLLDVFCSYGAVIVESVFFFFFFLNICCVDTEKNKWFKTGVSSHLNRMRRVRILCFTGADWRHITEETWLFKQIYFRLCDCLLTCGHF